MSAETLVMQKTKSLAIGEAFFVSVVFIVFGTVFKGISRSTHIFADAFHGIAGSQTQGKTEH
jgi:ABC-type thiamin/hydroxymethylpyrimidine transport system permease subunit